MIRSRCRLRPIGLRLLAILVVCLAPTVAAANHLGFTNKCPAPVVVHTSAVVKGRLVRNKPFMLRHLESSPAIPRTNDLTITIADGRAVNRVLFQGALRAGTNKLSFDIVPDGPNRVRVVREGSPAGGGARGPVMPPPKGPRPRR